MKAEKGGEVKHTWKVPLLNTKSRRRTVAQRAEAAGRSLVAAAGTIEAAAAAAAAAAEGNPRAAAAGNQAVAAARHSRLAVADRMDLLRREDLGLGCPTGHLARRVARSACERRRRALSV